MAVELASALHTGIISADSRQCYRELNIGVAKPGKEELEKVHHYFINSHSIHEEVTAAGFEQYALKACKEVFKKNEYAVMVGGTGLYLKAFCEGLDNMPEIDKQIREAIIQEYTVKGLAWLQKEVAEKDPDFWHTAEQQNPHRLMRALEVLLQTGKSIASFRTNHKTERPFNIKKIALTLPKNILHQRINDRVDTMIEQGLVEEVKSLIPFQDINALQTVGYKELFAYLNGTVTLSTAIEQIKTNTRRYAKRQVTWFKKDDSIKWLESSAEALPAIIADIKPSIK